MLWRMITFWNQRLKIVVVPPMLMTTGVRVTVISIRRFFKKELFLISSCNVRGRHTYLNIIRLNIILHDHQISRRARLPQYTPRNTCRPDRSLLLKSRQHFHGRKQLSKTAPATSTIVIHAMAVGF